MEEIPELLGIGDMSINRKCFGILKLQNLYIFPIKDVMHLYNIHILFTYMFTLIKYKMFEKAKPSMFISNNNHGKDIDNKPYIITINNLDNNTFNNPMSPPSIPQIQVQLFNDKEEEIYSQNKSTQLQPLRICSNCYRRECNNLCFRWDNSIV
jgi:hypothetical protein